jgi:hypothetical protein
MLYKHISNAIAGGKMSEEFGESFQATGRRPDSNDRERFGNLNTMRSFIYRLRFRLSMFIKFFDNIGKI